MASIIRVRRSTGINPPGSLNFGELGLTVGVGTANNSGGRVFAGDNSNNPQVVGGRYFTDLLSIDPGKVASQANPTTAANGFVAILDSDRKVDQWNVDNLTLDGNTFSSTNTDGDLIFNPGGSGEVMVPDDTKLGFGGGADGTGTADSTIEYDEDGTDKIVVSGASWQFNCGIGITGGTTIDNIQIKTDTIASTSGNVMYIDPYPDGLSSEGLLVVKGSLQVDGTTTTVNSTNATLNDPVMHIGDVTSQKTVTATIASGVSTATLDSVVGINTGDILTATSINASGVATVSSYNTTSKVVTFSGTTSAGIALSLIHI